MTSLLGQARSHCLGMAIVHSHTRSPHLLLFHQFLKKGKSSARKRPQISFQVFCLLVCYCCHSDLWPWTHVAVFTQIISRSLCSFSFHMDGKCYGIRQSGVLLTAFLPLINKRSGSHLLGHEEHPEKRQATSAPKENLVWETYLGNGFYLLFPPSRKLISLLSFFYYRNSILSW